MRIVTVNGKKGYYIFRASKRNRDGSIIYAKDYNLKAFRIFIPL